MLHLKCYLLLGSFPASNYQSYISIRYQLDIIEKLSSLIQIRFSQGRFSGKCDPKLLASDYFCTHALKNEHVFKKAVTFLQLKKFLAKVIFTFSICRIYKKSCLGSKVCWVQGYSSKFIIRDRKRSKCKV